MPSQSTEHRQSPRITVAVVQARVGDHFGLCREELLSKSRCRSITTPRQIAMYLAKTLTQQSYPSLGRRFGGRDHTTVLHAVRKVAALQQSDVDLARLLDGLALDLTLGCASPIAAANAADGSGPR